MRRIHKYPLIVTDKQLLRLPLGATVMDVQFQNNQLMLWAMVNPQEQATTEHVVRIIGTGHDIEKYPGEYAATVQQYEGQLVWHVFIEDAVISPDDRQKQDSPA